MIKPKKILFTKSLSYLNVLYKVFFNVVDKIVKLP